MQPVQSWWLPIFIGQRRMFAVGPPTFDVRFTQRINRSRRCRRYQLPPICGAQAPIRHKNPSRVLPPKPIITKLLLHQRISDQQPHIARQIHTNWHITGTVIRDHHRLRPRRRSEFTHRPIQEVVTEITRARQLPCQPRRRQHIRGRLRPLPAHSTGRRGHHTRRHQRRTSVRIHRSTSTGTAPPDEADAVAGTVAAAPPATAGDAGPPIPGGGSIIPPAPGAPAAAPPGVPTADTGVCAPEAANPAGTAAGAADVAPATEPAATGEAVPGNAGGGLTGETAPAAPELAAILRVNDADGSTPGPGRLGTPDPGTPDKPDGVVAPGNPPTPDDNPDNGLPPPKPPRPPADNPRRPVHHRHSTETVAVCAVRA